MAQAHRSTTARPRFRPSALALAILLAVLPTMTGPIPARAADIVVDRLLEAELGALPPPPAFLRLIRITLQPGAGVATHSHPGPELALVESGTLAVTAGGDLAVSRATGGPERAGADGGLLLAAGDRVAFPAGVSFAFSSAGDAPAVLLTLVILPAGPDRPPGADIVATPATGEAGVSSRRLGDAVAPGWPATPATVTIDRLTIPAGEPVPAVADPAMFVVERGALGFALRGGEYEVSLAGGPPRPRAGDGVEQRLGPGDAVFFPGGVNALPREAAAGDLVLVRVTIAGPGPGTPGPEPATPVAAAAAPSATDDAFAPGSEATIVDDGVRLRTEPSLDAPVVGELAAGTVVTVSGPPAAGSGETWYPVTNPNDEDAAGFVSEAFLAPAD